MLKQSVRFLLFPFVVLFFALPSLAQSRANTLYVPAPEAGTSEIYDYYVSILQLVLDSTQAQYGPTNVIAYENAVTQSRQLQQLQSKQVDITWAMTSLERELKSEVVYFPLAGGLFGQRVFIISKQNASHFSPDITAAKLQSLIAVQGFDWPDTDILKFNGFSVDTADYNSSFKIIENNMADYFPRSVLEVQAELDHRVNSALILEKNVALTYTAPIFFFIEKSNRKLAKRVREGLQQILNSGQFAAHYHSYQFVINAKNLMEGRTIIRLVNPNLSIKAQNAMSIIKRYSPNSPMID